ncbi:MAG: tetratricopeptide repeat protein [Planctomycetaceae bacterium]|nr:tetratricopeptide repeat protein [Planctomycetaceae bacterium]
MTFSSSAKASERRRIRKLNPRAAVILGVTAIVFIGGLRKLHDRQYARTLDYLRHSATEAIEQKDYARALSLLQQYVPARFADIEARERLSWLLETHVGTPFAIRQAFHLNEDLLRGSTPMADLRMRQARMAVDVGRDNDAEAHLRILRNSETDNSEVWLLTGKVQYNQRAFTKARQSLEKAISCSRPVADAFELLVQLNEYEKRPPSESEQLMLQMVDRCETADGHRIYAMWLLKEQRAPEAFATAWHALQSAPDDLALNRTAARSLQQLSQKWIKPTADTSAESPTDHEPSAGFITSRTSFFTAAREFEQHVRRQIEARPLRSELPRYLAAVLWAEGKQTEAVRELQQAIVRNPVDFILHFTAIDYLVSMNHPDQAENMLKAIPSGGMSTGRIEFLKGRIAMARRQWAVASRAFDLSLAYDTSQPDLSVRLRMCQAACRRQLGDFSTAMDAYRTTMAEGPHTESGRLGLALSYMESGQTDLAIAEFRQLKHLDGVPAYLASLLIQQNLQREPSIRNWKEVEELIRESDPFIDDAVQRLMLRSDMLFAMGQLDRVIPLLEDAEKQFPGRPEIRRAIDLLNNNRSDSIARRLNLLIQWEPLNPSVQASMVRLKLASENLTAAIQQLDEFAGGASAGEGSLESHHRMRTACDAAVLAADMEARAGHRENALALSAEGVRLAERLAVQDPLQFPRLIQQLVRSDRMAEAAQRIRTHLEIPAELRSVAWIELVRFSQNHDEAVRVAAPEMVELIRAQPDSSALRIAYAEMLLSGGQTAAAEQTLNQLLTIHPDSLHAMSRLAWIRAGRIPISLSGPGQNPQLTESEVGEILYQSVTALQADPENALIRASHARVMLGLGRIPEAMQTLLSPEPIPTVSALVCEAAIQTQLGHYDKARELAQEAETQSRFDPILPADQELLDAVLRTLERNPVPPRNDSPIDNDDRMTRLDIPA